MKKRITVCFLMIALVFALFPNFGTANAAEDTTAPELISVEVLTPTVEAGDVRGYRTGKGNAPV